MTPAQPLPFCPNCTAALLLAHMGPFYFNPTGSYDPVLVNKIVFGHSREQNRLYMHNAFLYYDPTTVTDTLIEWIMSVTFKIEWICVR